MRITKYEHACLDIQQDNTRIIIDPGKFTKSLTNYADINALVITHIHSDHFLLDTVQKIISSNPNIKVFTVNQVASQIKSKSVNVVSAGEKHIINNVILTFHGGDHEFYNEFENIAVMIDNKLYHPGDSYTVPKTKFEALASPASAPWLRVKDAGSFIANCKPKIAFPIHNAVLSPEGEEIHYRILGEECKQLGVSWKILQPGDTLEI